MDQTVLFQTKKYNFRSHASEVIVLYSVASAMCKQPNVEHSEKSTHPAPMQRIKTSNTTQKASAKTADAFLYQAPQKHERLYAK